MREFSRTLGVLDPLVGVDWRQDLGRKWTTHVLYDVIVWMKRHHAALLAK